MTRSASKGCEPPLSGPEPYYQDEAVTLYHGDCRVLLDSLPNVDAVVTDPPYGIGVSYSDEFDDTPDYVDEIGSLVPALRAKAPTVAITPGTVNLWRYPPTPSVLAWIHTTNTAAARRDPIARLMRQRSWQPVLVYGDRWAILRADTYAAATIPNRDGLHPCAKPDHFATWLVRRVTKPGTVSTILDPFCGSGAFIVAAKLLGHRAIGIEIEERYCDLAARRLSQDCLDLPVA